MLYRTISRREAGSLPPPYTRAPSDEEKAQWGRTDEGGRGNRASYEHLAAAEGQGSDPERIFGRLGPEQDREADNELEDAGGLAVETTDSPPSAVGEGNIATEAGAISAMPPSSNDRVIVKEGPVHLAMGLVRLAGPGQDNAAGMGRQNGEYSYKNYNLPPPRLLAGHGIPGALPVHPGSPSGCV